MHSRTASLVYYLLAGLIAFAGTFWIAFEWQAQLDGGRTRTLATSHTRRMVEYPGVEAWLVGLLESAGAQLPYAERQTYDALRLESTDLATMPEAAQRLAERLQAPAPLARATTLSSVAPAQATRLEYMRTVQHVHVGDRTLVLTRRRSLSERGPIEPEIERAAAHLIALAEAHTPSSDSSFADSPLIRSGPQLARFYAVFEDGSVLIMPVAGSSDDPLAEQTAQAWRRPLDPSLASLSVFPQFDFGRALAQQVHYTGLYPDVTGLGFVATVSVPVHYSDRAMKMFVAADLTVAIALDRLIAGADKHLQLQIADVVEETATPTWKPWTTLATSLASEAPLELREDVREQTLLEDAIERRPLVWAETAHGVLFAQQIQRDKWLVGLARTPSVPWLPLVFVPLSLLGLVVVVERRGARAEHERELAERHARQHDQALELLQLPLVVVDPNDDAIVHANAVAEREFGLVPGRVVHEHLVAGDPRSQKHYHDHQVLAGGRRRAYGVRLRPEAEGHRFALIRSISLTHALPEFHAVANHRLGVICPLEGDADLAPLLADALDAARQDERNKLATIIDHGVDVLARVLAARLCSPDEVDREFRRWLADYLFGRLHVTQWILDHWGGPECRDVDCILGPEHLRAALTRYREVFARVGDDPLLRAQLRWNNGTLASPSDEPAMKIWIDWPDEYRLTTPGEGIFGYFLGEVLINAIKHGAPGVPIEIDVDVDRARRELCVRVRNLLLGPADEHAREAKAYGGSAILTELARVCGWQLARTRERDTFELRWLCPVTVQRPAGLID
ncbi:hypothetical protein ACNOYE_29245 [Nannocystaceae bacterium ST9]